MDIVRLYHGSDAAVRKPDLTHNTGYADLGKGFYLTDDRDAAKGRADSRARRVGGGQGVVSAYDFNKSSVEWVCIGSKDGLPYNTACSTRASLRKPLPTLMKDRQERNFFLRASIT